MSTSIVLVGVGGQGVIMASQIIGEAAMGSGRDVIMSEVHGMAQRGGVVVCSIKIDETNSSLIGKGTADFIVGFEPIETYRAMGNASRDTMIVTTTASIVPFTVNVGKEAYPNVDEVLASIRDETENLYTLDAQALATEAGAAITENVVMMGAMAGLPGFPLEPDVLRDAVKRLVPEKYLDINMRAFDLGYKATHG